MVYKKWIKKDGKLYGPYIYESKRIDGKVVSEYHGPRKTFNIKKYSWIFISAAVLILIAYSLSTFDFGSMTGEAVLDTKVNYVSNEPISGNLIISLKQGEFLPANSKIILENSGQTYEYDLSKFVSENPASGNFYLDGVPLSGSGDGYGIGGKKIIYPEISFVLNIYPAESEIPTTEPVPEPTTVPTDNETNAVNETPATETATMENVPAENPATETVPPENSATETATTESSATETPVETSENLEAPSETTSSESEAETSPITGFFVKAYNFFLGLTLTGKAVSESGITEINGQASLNNPFIYGLSGGEGVQLKPGSVFASGSSIPDDNVNIKVEGNQVIVETFYSEVQEGFGQEFLGEEIKILNVDLSEMGLVLNDGELKIKIVSENNEIFLTSLMLEPGETNSIIENISNSTTLNITIEQPINNTLNKTNETVSVIFGEKVPQIINFGTAQFVLTEEDKALLSEAYGDIVISTSKSEIINDKLVKRYEIGKDWIEFSYNPNDSEEKIEVQASIDRMKWLKDLAQRIKLKKEAEKESSPQIVETFSVE